MEYFDKNPKYISHVEETANCTVSVSLTEIIRSMTRKKFKRDEIRRALTFIARKSTILPVDETAAIRAGFLAEEHGLHFSDALIYAFASKDRPLVTGDVHFKSKPNVEFLE